MSNVKPSLPLVDTLLFFGSFDPVTLGHEALISAGLDLLHPASILLIPANQQGWGKQLSAFTDRVAMLEATIALHPDWRNVVHVCTVEADAKLSGITAETLRYLDKHTCHGQQVGLLMGTDWILSMPSWEEWTWMLTRAYAFVALRGKDTKKSLVARMPDDLVSLLDDKVFIFADSQKSATKHISSTEVRDSFRRQKQTAMVNEKVFSYATIHMLYKALPLPA